MMVGLKAGRQDLVSCVWGGRGEEEHQQVWIKPGDEKPGRGRGEKGPRRGI